MGHVTAGNIGLSDCFDHIVSGDMANVVPCSELLIKKSGPDAVTGEIIHDHSKITGVMEMPP